MLRNPARLIWLAAGLMVMGAVLPFLMVIHVLEATFFLSFVSFISQTIGFILGFMGLALYRAGQKHKRDDEWDNK